MLNSNNYFVWPTLLESELDNLGCHGITTGDPTKMSAEMERKSYHLLIRYLNEGMLGFVADVLKPEEKGKGSIC